MGSVLEWQYISHFDPKVQQQQMQHTLLADAYGEAHTYVCTHAVYKKQIDYIETFSLETKFRTQEGRCSYAQILYKDTIQVGLKGNHIPYIYHSKWKTFCRIKLLFA